MTIPAKVQEEINRAVKLKSRAKELEKEAKVLNNTAKEILLPVMTAYEVSNYTLNGVGIVLVKTSKGSSINETKLREELLIHGCTVEEIDAIISSSSKSWSTEYIEFKEVK